MRLQIIALERYYEQKYALASLHNQANWNRLDPTYNGKIIQDMANMLNICVNDQQIEQHRKKLYTLSRLLLQRAKEERIFTLDTKAIERVKIEPLILHSYESVKGLGKPIQLLFKNETAEKYLFTDPAVLERLFTINFWNICESKKGAEDIITLTITNTFLSYPYHAQNEHKKQLKSPKLPALAFSISSGTDSLEILPTYEVADKITSSHLPKTIHNLYQEESKQIVQAHGGYIQTIETEIGLTCLYILPVDGKKMMQFKRYCTNDLFNKVAETDESLVQEKKLISILLEKTTLTEKKVQETIKLIKKAHGAAIRRSGEPYYTHPMEVAKIVLEATKNDDTILAALLHDVVEDTMVTLEQIELLYGIEVAYVVDMVTHYNNYRMRWKLDNSDHKDILNQCQDIRVVQIKLADRLHNLRTIVVRKPEDQKRIAQDTKKFYIPWAKKNKVSTWVLEMERICNQILHKNYSRSNN